MGGLFVCMGHACARAHHAVWKDALRIIQHFTIEEADGRARDAV